jgi:hypothetical protein
MLRALLVTVAVGFALCWALALFAAWRAFRALRRRLHASPAVRAVRAWTTPPGPRRQVARLRQELAAAVQATPRAVALVGAADGAVGELPLLARRLQRVAGTLDDELRLLAAEPDPPEVARVLPAARARVADVTRVARDVRRAASAGLGAHTASVVGDLAGDVDREVTALAGGVDALLALASGQPTARARAG